MVSGPLVQGVAAIGAIKRRKVRGQAGSLVACGAGCGLVGDSPIRMRECRASPCSGVVAGRARGRSRETCAGVIRYISAERRGALPVCRVATVAIGRWRIRCCMA